MQFAHKSEFYHRPDCNVGENLPGDPRGNSNYTLFKYIKNHLEKALESNDDIAAQAVERCLTKLESIEGHSAHISALDKIIRFCNERNFAIVLTEEELTEDAPLPKRAYEVDPEVLEWLDAQNMPVEQKREILFKLRSQGVFFGFDVKDIEDKILSLGN